MIPDDLVISVTDVLTYQQKKERVAVPARHFSAISLRLKTAGKYRCKGKTVAFRPGSVCVIPEGVAYERTSLAEEIPVIHFRMLNFVMEEIRVFPVEDAGKYEALFGKALFLKRQNEAGGTYRLNAVLYEILAELARDAGAAAHLKDRRVLESAEYMRQHLSDPSLSIEALAGIACVSPAYYRREFRRVFRASPKDYLDTLRIQYAKSLLETGCFSQKEVAARCGYAEADYFRTAFKRKVGKSIRAYLADPTKFDY